MTYVVSPPLAGAQEWLRQARAQKLDVMQVIRMGPMMLLRPQLFDAIMAYTDIPFEGFVALASHPWNTPKEDLEKHPLYPLYRLERDPYEVALSRVLRVDGVAVAVINPSGLGKLVLYSGANATCGIGRSSARKPSALGSLPGEQLLEVYEQPLEEEAKPAGDPVGSLAPNGGELLRVDPVAGHTSDEGHAPQEEEEADDPDGPGVRLQEGHGELE